MKNKPEKKELFPRLSTEFKDARKTKIHENARAALAALAKITKTSSKELGKSTAAPTRNARIDRARTSVRYGEWLKKVDKDLKKLQKKYEAMLKPFLVPKERGVLESLAAANQITAIVEKYEKKAASIVQAMLYGIYAIAGANKKLDVSEFKELDSLRDAVNKLYSHNVDVADLFIRVHKETLQPKHRKLICKYMKQYPYESKVTNDRARMQSNVTAILFGMMNPYQRMQIMDTFQKTYGYVETKKAVDGFTKAGLFTLKQRESLLSKYTGKNYVTSTTEQKRFLSAQKKARVISKEIEKNQDRPYHVNGATLLINRKSLFGIALLAISSMTVFTGIARRLNEGKGLGRLKGLSSPYVWAGVLGAGFGSKMMRQGMTPGRSVGGGWLEKLIPKVKTINRFGAGKEAVKKDEQFTAFSNSLSNYPLIEKYTLYQNGIDDLTKFRQKKHIQVYKQAAYSLNQKEKSKGSKRRVRFLSEYIAFLKSNGNKRGAASLEKAARVYGYQKTEELVLTVGSAMHDLNVLTTRSFNHDKAVQGKFTFNQLLRDRQGLKKLPRQKIPRKA